MKHTLLIFVFTLAMAQTIFAEEMTDAERATHKAAVIAKVGGLLPRPGTPSGRIVFINTQKIVPIDEFKATFKKNSTRIKGVDYWTDGSGIDVASAFSQKQLNNAQFAVFLVDSENLPMSLIAPEECWAIMNVRPLTTDTTNTNLVVHRAKNEFARIYGLLCGGISSQFPSAIMNNITKPSDLNGCTDELPVDVTAKMPFYTQLRGVKAEQLTSYQKACYEGWAPQPTNDVQKAIWDKVHAMPTEPLKIKPETKKMEK